MRREPADHVAERRPVAPHARDAAAAVMAGLRRPHAQRSDGDLLAGRDLAHGVEPAPQQQAPAAARHDDRHAAADPPQRGQIEVVAVQMRQQNGVEVAQRLRRRQRRVPPQMRHPVAQQRVA